MTTVIGMYVLKIYYNFGSSRIQYAEDEPQDYQPLVIEDRGTTFRYDESEQDLNDTSKFSEGSPSAKQVITSSIFS